VQISPQGLHSISHTHEPRNDFNDPFNTTGVHRVPESLTNFLKSDEFCTGGAQNTNRFNVTAETIGNYTHFLEEFVRADPSKWSSGIGRFLAFRCLTAWPFPRGPIEDHSPSQEFGVECAKAVAVMFEATRLPPTLLKQLLSDWVTAAARGINLLVKAWALDCGRAPGGWVFVTQGTDLVAGCGVGWPLIAPPPPPPAQWGARSLSMRTVDSHSVASEVSSLGLGVAQDE
jgi:hypothetical protein